jgi:hypothetical protein
MGDEVQQLRNFGLEGKGLFAHGVDQSLVREKSRAEGGVQNLELWVIGEVSSPVGTALLALAGMPRERSGAGYHIGLAKSSAGPGPLSRL